LHLKGGWLVLARGRGTTAGSVDAVDLLDVVGGAVDAFDGLELQPGDSELAADAVGSVGRGGSVIELGGRDVAVCATGGDLLAGEGDVEVEERGGGTGEVVHAGLGEGAGPEDACLVEVKVDGDTGDHLEDVWVGGGEAAGVEESGEGAVGHGLGRGVAGVAGVVLGTAADSNVVDGEACRRRGERDGSNRNAGLGEVTLGRDSHDLGSLDPLGEEVEVGGQVVDGIGRVGHVLEVESRLGRGGRGHGRQRGHDDCGETHGEDVRLSKAAVVKEIVECKGIPMVVASTLCERRPSRRKGKVK
jgi:hypothetical protein